MQRASSRNAGADDHNPANGHNKPITSSNRTDYYYHYYYRANTGR
jgi:hypothetical protein